MPKEQKKKDVKTEGRFFRFNHRIVQLLEEHYKKGAKRNKQKRATK